MSDNFDPYYKWLAIPPEEQPPHLYRLLGVQVFESDGDVIATAADQRMAHLRTFQAGKHGPFSQQLLNEIATARVCLLNPAKKAAYDQQLRADLLPRAPLAPPQAPSGPPVGAAPPIAPPPRGPIPVAPTPAMMPAPVGPAMPVQRPPGARVASFSAPIAVADADDSISDVPGARRSRKKKPSSLPAAVPIGAVGLVVIVALIVFSRSEPSTPSHSGVAPDERQSLAESAAAFPRKPEAEQHSAEPETADSEPDELSQTDPADEPEPPPKTIKPKIKTPPPPKNPQGELLSPPAKKLLLQVANHVSAGTIEQTEPAGAGGGGLFEEIPRNGALLIGLNLAVGDDSGRRVLRAVQAVYLSAGGIVGGEAHGDLGTDYVKLLAKPGYAVGGLRVRAGSSVDGLALVFMRIREDRLDPRASYLSAWAGDDRGSAPIAVSGAGRAVVGILGSVGAQLDQFGLMLDEPPLIPTAEMPAEEPNESRPLAEQPSSLPSKQRLPAPSSESQADSLALIRSLFKDGFADAAKGSTQKMALAKTLFHKAEETNDDPTARYVLASEARDLAAKCGDSLGAADAIVLLASHYDIDDIGMTLTSFERAAEVTSSPPQYRRKLVENCLLLIDRAVAKGKYEVADQLIAIGRRAGAKAQDSVLTQRLTWRAAKLRDQKAAYDEAREPLEILKTQPDNPQALTAVGRFRCFYQDDWRAGLSLLAKGDDPALKAVARQEIADPRTPEAQFKLAEAWDALGKADEKQRANCERRAKHWYAMAVFGLRGINKAKVEKRLDELLEGRGLKAEYFRDEILDPAQRVLTRIDLNIDFNWGDGSPLPEESGDKFSVRWTGSIVAPGKGEYKITVEHDDGVRIWVDGKLLLDRWDVAQADHFLVGLGGKPRAIKIEYRDSGHQARMILKWAQKGGFTEQVIPPEAFWQDHTGGLKAFSPLPNPPYPATFSALPQRQTQPVDEDPQ